MSSQPNKFYGNFYLWATSTIKKHQDGMTDFMLHVKYRYLVGRVTQGSLGGSDFVSINVKADDDVVTVEQFLQMENAQIWRARDD